MEMSAGTAQIQLITVVMDVNVMQAFVILLVTPVFK